MTGNRMQGLPAEKGLDLVSEALASIAAARWALAEARAHFPAGFRPHLEQLAGDLQRAVATADALCGHFTLPRTG